MIASKGVVAERQNRVKKGWQVVKTAAKLLGNKYPIKKVSVFGSLLKPDQFRRHSDLDIAVWGLSDQYYYQAVNDLADLSQEFSVDIVQFESASPSLQNVIVQQSFLLSEEGIKVSDLEYFPSTRSASPIMSEYAVLLSQIEQDIKELEKLVQKTQNLLDKMRVTEDEDYVGAIALNLHSFYSGSERIFKQIAQTVEGTVPDSADWHRQLLRQVSTPIRNIRPAVLQLETVAMLNDYCSFRHVVRNLYSFNLKVERVEKLAEELPSCWNLLQKDLAQFIQEM